MTATISKNASIRKAKVKKQPNFLNVPSFNIPIEEEHPLDDIGILFDPETGNLKVPVWHILLDLFRPIEAS